MCFGVFALVCFPFLGLGVCQVLFVLFQRTVCRRCFSFFCCSFLGSFLVVVISFNVFCVSFEELLMVCFFFVGVLGAGRLFVEELRVLGVASKEAFKEVLGWSLVVFQRFLAFCSGFGMVLVVFSGFGMVLVVFS